MPVLFNRLLVVVLRNLFYILQDVRPYMNPSPYTVYPDTPVPQVFNLFRSMGLRHLPVVDHYGQVRLKKEFLFYFETS